MKKIFFPILLMCFCIFLFSSPVSASAEVDVNTVVDTIVDIIQSDLDITLTNSSNADFVSFCNDWIDNSELHFSYWKYQNNYMQLMLTSNVTFNNDNTVSYTYSKAIRYTFSNSSWSNYSTTGATSTWNLSNGVFVEHGELMDEISEESYMYNPVFPKLLGNLVYDSDGSDAFTAYSIPARLLVSLPTFYGDGIDTYFQIYYRFSAPSYVNLFFNNGEVVYTPSSFVTSEWYDFYNGNSVSNGPFNFYDIDGMNIKNYFQLQANTNTMTSNLAAFIADANSDITWGTVSGIDPVLGSSYVDQAKLDFTTYNRSALNLGNSLEIRFRVYRVSASGVRFVSPWTTVKSVRPATFTLSSAYNFSAGQDVGTTSSVSTESEYDFGSGVFDPVDYGDTTVSSNYNVPNTLNYPTIADFNRDKLLTGYIQTAKQLPAFFGDFGSFLADAFVFIPDVIWGIVALGFSASIVVMILKIL